MATIGPNIDIRHTGNRPLIRNENIPRSVGHSFFNQLHPRFLRPTSPSLSSTNFTLASVTMQLTRILVSSTMALGILGAAEVDRRNTVVNCNNYYGYTASPAGIDAAVDELRGKMGRISSLNFWDGPASCSQVSCVKESSAIYLCNLVGAELFTCLTRLTINAIDRTTTPWTWRNSELPGTALPTAQNILLTTATSMTRVGLPARTLKKMNGRRRCVGVSAETGV